MDALQTLEASANASVGQELLTPLQVSATSQTPAEARHTVPALINVCVTTPPLQKSAVHALPSSVTGTLTVKWTASLLPQAFLAITTTSPLTEPTLTVMLFVVLVPTHPDGKIQV